MSADEIRLRLSSVFDPTGSNAAKKSMSDLGKAATILGNGIGGALSKVGNMAKDLLTGGIWAAGARLVMFFWDSFISPAARAERALERAKKKSEEFLAANAAHLKALRETYDATVSQIDDTIRRRNAEIDSVKDLTKAEIELARQRRIAAGADETTANAAAAELLGEVDREAATQKAANNLKAAEERLAASEKAETARIEELNRLEESRASLNAEMARMEREVYDRTYKHARHGRRGRYLRSKHRWSYVGKHTEAESRERARAERDRFKEGDKEYLQKADELKKLDEQLDEARRMSAEATKAVEDSRGRLEVAERAADALKVKQEADVLKTENERAKKIDEEMERQREEAARLTEIREAETARQVEFERRERERMERELAQKRIAELRDELSIRRREESEAQSRQSAAQGSLSTAWGWYRDKSQMQAVIDERKAQAAAEVQWQKDFERLKTWRRDWRTADFGSLSAADEAVRQVAFAKEEKAAADRAVIETAENTRDLAEKLDELIGMKGGE